MDVADAKLRIEAVMNDFIDGLEEMPVPNGMSVGEFSQILRSVIGRTRIEVSAVSAAYVRPTHAESGSSHYLRGVAVGRTRPTDGAAGPDGHSAR